MASVFWVGCSVELVALHSESNRALSTSPGGVHPGRLLFVLASANSCTIVGFTTVATRLTIGWTLSLSDFCRGILSVPALAVI